MKYKKSPKKKFKTLPRRQMKIRCFLGISCSSFETSLKTWGLKGAIVWWPIAVRTGVNRSITCTFTSSVVVQCSGLRVKSFRAKRLKPSNRYLKDACRTSAQRLYFSPAWTGSSGFRLCPRFGGAELASLPLDQLGCGWI